MGSPNISVMETATNHQIEKYDGERKLVQLPNLKNNIYKRRFFHAPLNAFSSAVDVTKMNTFKMGVQFAQTCEI